MASLREYITKRVQPREYYSSIFPDIKWPSDGQNGPEPRVHSPLREEERTPSLSINPSTGAWFDFGASDEDGSDGVGGNDLVSFHAALLDCEIEDAARDLFHTWVHPTIDLAKVKKWTQTLEKTPSARGYITRHRRISPATIQKYQVGWDGVRITVPIFNEFGLCVNVKRFDPLGKRRGRPKALNYDDGLKSNDPKKEKREFGDPIMLFPLSAFKLARRLGFIFVVEGEWDALALLSLGIPAVTATGGSKSWPAQYTEMFRGLEVIVCYDNDGAGRSGAKRAIKHLRKVATVIRQIFTPKVYGKDPTDWIKNGPTSMSRAKGWLKARDRSKTIVENPDGYIDKSTDKAVEVSLDQARDRDKIGQLMRIKAVVAGKATDPLLVPVSYRIACDKKHCDDSCPLHGIPKDFIDGTIDLMSEQMFDLMQKPKNQVKKALFRQHGFSPDAPCHPKLEILEYAAWEELRVQPTLDSDSKEHVVAQAYTYGLGIRANQAYNFEGTVYPSDQGNLAKLLLTSAEPAQTQADTFKMNIELRDQLKVFQPKAPTTRKVMQRLMDIAEWQSRNVTHIRERPDLHIGVDLVYHSVSELTFNDEHIPRGMLDVMVIGDTRCGKGFVAEGLQRYYGLGEVASGENCTFAGLVGGVQQVGKQWFITWGIIPMNHNRMVIIDEASSIADNDGFAKLSRVRSEGVAEITKIVRESTAAKARLLWLANPVSGRPIMSYSSGVHALKELVGANEDISRFDFALTVANDEVDAKIINEVRHKSERSDINKYPKHLMKSLALWAWSRTKDQIRFTAEAVTEVIKEAIEFGKRYTSTIPLIQAENIRIKLAKVAAAVAARTFSCDETGEILVVDREHVQAACQFLRQIYSKPSMAYDAFSRNDKEDSQMKPDDTIEKIFDKLGEHRDASIKYLVQNIKFQADGLRDFCGDLESAKELIRELVVAQAITRSPTSNFYIRSRDFTRWLREKRKGMA